MIDVRPVLHVVGITLCLLAATMVLPAGLDAVDGNREWTAFAASAGLTLFVGLALMLGNATPAAPLSVRQAFLATALGWLAPCLFAALPLAFGPLNLSATDAVFEAASAITTTGSTVIHGLDGLPRGLLLWRGLLQWLGGIGVIVMAVAVLPVLAIGGMQIFRIEVSGISERTTPRAARIGSVIVGVYAGLTALLGVLLWLAGMTGFEAVVHAMSAISTGGFSTSDASVGHFDSAAIDVIVTLGMVVGGMPFLLFFQLAQGNLRTVGRDQQLHWYLGLLLLATVGVSLWLAVSRGLPALEALRYGGFTVASVMTGTGLFTADYGSWTGLPVAILFFLAFVGGCAGSTAAGIKVFRFQLLFASARVQLRQLLRPHAVMVPTFNRRPIPEEVLESVMGFVFVYAFAFAVVAMALAFLGLDFVTAVSGAASAISNVGPGLGHEIGPGTTFAGLPDAAKWLLAATMVFGRVEMFPILVLFVPTFWKP